MESSRTKTKRPSLSGVGINRHNLRQRASQGSSTDAMHVENRHCAMSTPNSLALARNRLDVRALVMGTMLASHVNTSQCRRSRPD